jgi:hypothetical protein
MKAAIRAGAGITMVAAITIALALPAAAHKAVGKPAVTCDEVSVQLEDFPTGPSEITFHIKVNGTDHTKTDSFTGPNGTSSVSISDLTTATGSLDIEAFASWTIEGGGQSDTTKVTKVCHETPQNPPTNETTPERPVTVAGATAEREQAAPATAPASAVSAAPRFTG